MICRRCGSDVAPTKFCSKCGALLNGKRCNSCGGIMGSNETFCAECGAPATVAPSQQQYMPRGGAVAAAPAQGYTQQGGGDVRPKLKKRTRAVVPTGNKHTRLRAILGALVSLGALATMVYFFVFGNLLTSEGTSLSPFIFDPATMGTNIAFGDFFLYKQISFIIDYFKSFATMGFSLDAMCTHITTIVYQVAYLVGALLLALAVIIGIIKFFLCIFGKKERDLLLPIELALVGFLSIYFSLSLMGISVSYTSGLMIGIYAAGAAILWQVVLNLALAGKRFMRGGSIMKWLSNVGFFVGAALMMLFMPKAITLTTGTPIDEAFGGLSAMISSGVMPEPMSAFVYAMILAVSQISFMWALPSAAVKAGKRLARTFKFDGYKDKGCLRKGLAGLTTAIAFTVFVYLATQSFDKSLIVFIVGGALMFVCSLINRIFLNKDQI